MAGAYLLLPLRDLYHGLNTRPFSFVGSLQSEQPQVLENLRSLGAMRNGISKASLQTTSSGQRVVQTERYLEMLAAFSDAHPKPASLCFEYTSPLGGQPDRFQRLPAVSCEHAMVLHIYASGLTEVAHEIVGALPAPLPPRAHCRDNADDSDKDTSRQSHLDPSAPSHPQAAQLLRGAAGIWAYLENHLPELAASPSDKRQPELVPAIAAALSKLALAEAQAVTAHRAQLRRSSPALVTALHMGTADLLEEAALAVKDAVPSCVAAPEHLKKLLALSWALSTARARQAWARAEMESGTAGSAVASLDEAGNVLRDCAAIAGEQTEWRTVWQAETAAVARERASADVLRETVHFQAVSKQPSKLPPGKQVVAALPYDLPAVDLTLFQV